MPRRGVKQGLTTFCCPVHHGEHDRRVQRRQRKRGCGWWCMKSTHLQYFPGGERACECGWRRAHNYTPPVFLIRPGLAGGHAPHTTLCLLRSRGPTGEPSSRNWHENEPVWKLSTIHHEAPNLSASLAGNGWQKRWKKLAPQYCRPKKPAIANHLARHEVHYEVPRGRVASDTRNRVPAWLLPISKLAQDHSATALNSRL